MDGRESPGSGAQPPVSQIADARTTALLQALLNGLRSYTLILQALAHIVLCDTLIFHAFSQITLSIFRT